VNSALWNVILRHCSRQECDSVPGRSQGCLPRVSCRDEYLHIARHLAVVMVLIPTGLAVAGAVELLERLRIDHSILVTTERDFRERRDRGTLQGVEAADYAAYVARLQRQVIEDCVALDQIPHEIPLPADLPCPATPPAVSQAAAIDQQAEQTGAEEVAALEAELAAGLGEFDELLLREQERVRAARPRPAESGGAGQGGAGEDGAGMEGSGTNGMGTERTGEEAVSGTGTGTDAGTGGSDGRSTGARGGTGTQRQGGAGGVPPDIPDGSDDDVVARQLREAAEKETDPALKKKLWEEYRKYKQGMR
jgi:hypothetical protein